jgi:hypothetical protein
MKRLETIGETLVRLHALMAPALGQMAGAIAKQAIRRGHVREWAERAEQLAQELREMEKRLG